MCKKDVNYYMVRTRDIIDDAVNIGWGKVDLSVQTDFINIENKFIEEYSKNDCPTSRGRKINQIKRFMNIKDGDIIIVPYYNCVRIAVAKYKFYDGGEFGNKLKVNFFKDKSNTIISVPRLELSEKFQRRLRVRGCTVADYNEFAEEIDKISSKDGYSYVSEIEEKFEEGIKQFKKSLLELIRKGDTHLSGGGIGLENLIKELLEIDGYYVSKTYKAEFKDSIADADIVVQKSDYIMGETQILIQVKHHDGITGVHALNQLLEIENGKEYVYNQRVLVTSAQVEEIVKTEAEKNNIRIIEGDELVDWIYDDLQHLSEITRIKLGISSVPQFI